MNKRHGFSFLIVVAIVLALFLTAKKPWLNNSNSINIYFTKANKTGALAAVRRHIKEGQNPLEVSMQQLLKGPDLTEKIIGLSTEIPKGTKLLGIKENVNSVAINLSDKFQSGGGSASMTSRLSQVTKTAQENSKAKEIYLEINGQRPETLGGEGIEIPQPLGVVK